MNTKPVIHKVISPIRICYYVTKKGQERWFSLNLNQYRNCQSHQLGTVKEAYTKQMLSVVNQLPKFDRISIKYTVFTGSSHKSDIMNWVAVIDKFFQDTLVKADKLTDDNYDYVPHIEVYWGEIDKKNPRVEIEIRELDEY